MHHWFLAPTPQRAAQFGAPFAYTRAWYAARASAQMQSSGIAVPPQTFEAGSKPPLPIDAEKSAPLSDSLRRSNTDSIHPARSVQTSIGRFSVFDELGRGAFGTVNLAKYSATGALCALKTVDKKLAEQFHGLDESMQMESQLMEEVGPHPNVVRKLGNFETDQVWGLALELANGGEVFDRLIQRGEYSEADAASITRQVSLALQHCHNAGVCHRDVKPANLLFSSPNREATVKLCDFGISLPICQEKNDRVRGERGTPGYMAPEMLGGGDYGTEVDMWSLGVVLFVRIFPCHPMHSCAASSMLMHMIAHIHIPPPNVQDPPRSLM